MTVKTAKEIFKEAFFSTVDKNIFLTGNSLFFMRQLGEENKKLGKKFKANFSVLCENIDVKDHWFRQCACGQD